MTPFTNCWFTPTEKDLAEVDIDQLRDNLALSFDDRLRRHEGARCLVSELRNAGKQLYGFDPPTITQAAD
ncbi:MAG: hypothetical protein U0796_19610 [Gemmatales bacterium]